MKTFSWSLAGLFLGVALAISPSCGTVAPLCSAASCPQGCCTAAGACVGGTSLNACGSSGSQCAECSLGQTCTLGTCANTVTGTGGGSGGSGGGAGYCSTPSSCANDPLPTATDIMNCNTAAAAVVAVCRPKYDALANCLVGKRVCDSSGKTDGQATVNKCMVESTGYSDCVTTNPADSGVPDAGPACPEIFAPGTVLKTNGVGSPQSTVGIMEISRGATKDQLGLSVTHESPLALPVTFNLPVTGLSMIVFKDCPLDAGIAGCTQLSNVVGTVKVTAYSTSPDAGTLTAVINAKASNETRCVQLQNFAFSASWP